MFGIHFLSYRGIVFCCNELSTLLWHKFIIKYFTFAKLVELMTSVLWALSCKLYLLVYISVRNIQKLQFTLHSFESFVPVYSLYSQTLWRPSYNWGNEVSIWIREEPVTICFRVRNIAIDNALPRISWVLEDKSLNMRIPLHFRYHCHLLHGSFLVDSPITWGLCSELMLPPSAASPSDFSLGSTNNCCSYLIFVWQDQWKNHVLTSLNK
jgi:hypothetical protein